jgi:diphthamide biosynthesis protein 3
MTRCVFSSLAGAVCASINLQNFMQVEIEDMDWSEELQAFTYQCPCGDLFQITLEELAAGEEIAKCPSCSLYVRVMWAQALACKGGILHLSSSRRISWSNWHRLFAMLCSYDPEDFQQPQQDEQGGIEA